MTDCIVARRIPVRARSSRAHEPAVRDADGRRRIQQHRHRLSFWVALVVVYASCVLVAVCHAQPGGGSSFGDGPVSTRPAPSPIPSPSVRPTQAPTPTQPRPTTQAPTPSTTQPRTTQPTPSTTQPTPSTPAPTPSPPASTQGPPPATPAPTPPPTQAPTPSPSPTTAPPSPTTQRPTPTVTPSPSPPVTPAPSPSTTAPSPSPTPEPVPEPTQTPRPLPTQPKDTPAPITPLPTPTPAPPANAPPKDPPVPKLTPGTGVTPTPSASPPPSLDPDNSTTDATETPSPKSTETPVPTASPTPKGDGSLKEASVKTTPTPTATDGKSEDAETSAMKKSGGTNPLMIGLIVGSVAFVVVAIGLFVFVKVRNRDDDDDDKPEPRRDNRDLQATTRNAPGYAQLSPVRPAAPYGQPPPPTNNNRLSQLLGPKPLMTNDQYSNDSLSSLHSSRDYGDSVDLHDPALDVLTPTSDIITVDPSSNMSFSSDASDHITGFNSLTESGKPKMYHSNDEYGNSAGSYASMTESGIQNFYKSRDTGENDVGGDLDDDDVDVDDEDVESSVMGLHDSMSSPPKPVNPWANAASSVPRVDSAMYSDLGDLDDSDPEDDEYQSEEDSSFVGSVRSNLSSISSGYEGSSRAGDTSDRFGSAMFSDDGSDFGDHVASPRAGATAPAPQKPRADSFSRDSDLSSDFSDDDSRSSTDSYGAY